MNKKYLYCPKCKKFPNKIKENYIEPIVREWNELDYGLEDNNFSEVEFKQECYECGTKLVERSEA